LRWVRICSREASEYGLLGPRKRRFSRVMSERNFTEKRGRPPRKKLEGWKEKDQPVPNRQVQKDACTTMEKGKGTKTRNVKGERNLPKQKGGKN